MHTEFAAVWDDDIVPGSDWLRHCVEYSKAHKDALVGANSRVFESIMSENTTPRLYAKESDLQHAARGAGFTGARVDYVGHSWVLKRVMCV